MPVPYRRLIFVADLTFESPLHLGSGGDSPITDSCVKRDIDGNPYIPGTSLAGVMRSVAERVMELATLKKCEGPEKTKTRERDDCSCLCCRLFGSAEHASLLTVDSAVLGDGGQMEVRDSVGISRERQTAAEQFKYDYEVSARQARFRSRLILDLGREERDAEIALLSHTFSWLGAGMVGMGGRTSSGLGDFHFAVADIYDLDFTQLDCLQAFLLHDDLEANTPELEKYRHRDKERFLASLRSSLTLQAHNSSPIWEPNRLVVDLELQIVEPLLVKGERETGAKQGAKLKPASWDVRRTRVYDLRSQDFGLPTRPDFDLEVVSMTTLSPNDPDGSSFLIPGSSLKGAFRARCEKLVRTLAYHYTGGSKDLSLIACSPLSKVELRACSRRLETFEDHERRRQKRDREGDADVARKINIWSCLVCRTFGSSQMKSKIRVHEAYPVRPDAISAKLFDHVAIDRFTGGALPKAKFDTQPLIDGTFSCSLELTRFEEWQIGLVALLLKDLHLEDLRIGHGKYKGYGKFKGVVKAVTIDCLCDSHLDMKLTRLGSNPAPYLDGFFNRHRFEDQDDLMPGLLGSMESPLRLLLQECVQKKLIPEIQRFFYSNPCVEVSAR